MIIQLYCFTFHAYIVYIHVCTLFPFYVSSFSSRRLLLCRVTLGKPVEQITATRIAHAPPGHHSVIGRPSAGGLNYPEYVIYRGEQVRRGRREGGRERKGREGGRERKGWEGRGEGDKFSFLTYSDLLQAYPEFLIAYKIVRPGAEPAADSTDGSLL